MPLNTKRHDHLFDKHTFNEVVHVIGAGGIGSAAARQLVKLGVGLNQPFHVWDGDIVEDHNPPNQVYNKDDIGKLKVVALQEHIERWSDGVKLICHPEYITERVSLSGIVFLCVDRMQARKDVCESSIWHNPDVSILFETRMDVSHAQLFIVDPCSHSHINQWNRYWFDDGYAEDEASCDGHLSIISTVEVAAGRRRRCRQHQASLRTRHPVQGHGRLISKPPKIPAARSS